LPSLDWRHHGIGALQAYVSQHVRVHIWHDKLLTPGMRDSGGIHDHRFRLESTILIGGLTNHEYRLDQVGPEEFNDDATWTCLPGPHDVYEVVNASTGKTDPPTKVGGPHTLYYRHTELEEGDTYSYPKREFHETMHHGTTITLVTKHDQEELPARLLAPAGTTPVHAFHASTSADRTTIQAILTEAEELLWSTLGERRPQASNLRHHR
jgi:hypothetical protein